MLQKHEASVKAFLKYKKIIFVPCYGEFRHYIYINVGKLKEKKLEQKFKYLLIEISIKIQFRRNKFLIL